MLLQSAACLQESAVEVANQAASIFKLTGISPASGGKVELLLVSSSGEQASVSAWPAVLGSFYSVQRLVLKSGIILRDDRYERGRRRFHAWRKLVDHLLVDGGTMKATA
jgi:hypothetical protein